MWIKAFNLQEVPILLSGGQGTTWSIGNHAKALFVADIMNEIVEIDFRVARPIKAVTDSWIYQDWIASIYIEGEHRKGLDNILLEKIATTIPACHQLMIHALMGRFIQLDLLMGDGGLDKTNEIKAYIPLLEMLSKVMK